MADISKITLPSGSTYNIKDAQARADIEAIEQAIASGVNFVGTTTTQLTDGATTNPITINGESYTATSGNLVIAGDKEFVFDGTKWIEFGDLGSLGELAFKDSASGTYTPAGTVSQPTFTGSSSDVNITVSNDSNGNYTPAGTVSQPTFTGSQMTATGKFTPSGTVSVTYQDIVVSKTTVKPAASGATTYTPEGTVSQPTFSGSEMTATGTYRPAGTVSINCDTIVGDTTTVSPAESGDTTYTPSGSVTAPTISIATAGSTTSVTSITDVGTLPELTATVANENLTLGFSQGTLPTASDAITVKTGDASYSASAPSFSGTGVRLEASYNMPDINSFTGTFSGTQATISVAGTPSGTVSQPTFSGAGVRLEAEYEQPDSFKATFSGTRGDVSVTGTPSGTVSQPTFTGTPVEISGTTVANGTVSKPTFTGTEGTITVS